MRQSPANRILLAIKTEGPQLASDLGAALGISSEAVRQQLARWPRRGLSRRSPRRHPARGRPRRLWHLTATGNGRFPDGHAELTANLLTLVAQLGKPALDAVIAARAEETPAYRNQVTAPDLPARVRQLAAIRTGEGIWPIAGKRPTDRCCWWKTIIRSVPRRPPAPASAAPNSRRFAPSLAAEGGARGAYPAWRPPLRLPHYRGLGPAC